MARRLTRAATPTWRDPPGALAVPYGTAVATTSAAKARYALGPHRGRNHASQGQTVTLMMRNVARDETRMVRHLVRELADHADEALSYEVRVASAEFVRATDPNLPEGSGTMILTAEQETVDRLGPDERTLITDLIGAIITDYTPVASTSPLTGSARCCATSSKTRSPRCGSTPGCTSCTTATPRPRCAWDHACPADPRTVPSPLPLSVRFCRRVGEGGSTARSRPRPRLTWNPSPATSPAPRPRATPLPGPPAPPALHRRLPGRRAVPGRPRHPPHRHRRHPPTRPGADGHPDDQGC
ncbi:hypothetical protein FMEAI12_2240003 [Parafrankia sp. Ea1.12]|nr:hypothetical protein FMEAI12_2240003 [Parafrankia sp. Ea1.12]